MENKTEIIAERLTIFQGFWTKNYLPKFFELNPFILFREMLVDGMQEWVLERIMEKGQNEFVYFQEWNWFGIHAYDKATLNTTKGNLQGSAVFQIKNWKKEKEEISFEFLHFENSLELMPEDISDWEELDISKKPFELIFPIHVWREKKLPLGKTEQIRKPNAAELMLMKLEGQIC